MIVVIFLFIIGCCSTKITPKDTDSSLSFYQDETGNVRLSSLNSAEQTKITKYEYLQDTLIIFYKKSAFNSSKNILPLQDDIKFLKCANQLYLVKRDGDKINILKGEQ